MPPPPLSLNWPGRRALLVVHGVGNATPGDYAPLVTAIRTALGAGAEDFAVYELYYDAYNDWMNDKMPLAQGIARMRSVLAQDFGGDDLGDAVAEFAGDVIWPILHLAPRRIIREVYLAQLKQIVLDGLRAGVGVWSQRISIICHSLGCFHTYEALHAAADEPAHALRPITNGVTFANVVFMASPVQLIRAVAARVPALVPDPNDLATLSGSTLRQPGQPRLTGTLKPSVEQWVSIAGTLDPVGGYLLGNRLPWAFMEVDDQVTVHDSQQLLAIGSKAQLAIRLRAALRGNGPPDIGLDNPHSWEGYVNRHATELRQWLTA